MNNYQNFFFAKMGVGFAFQKPTQGIVQTLIPAVILLIIYFHRLRRLSRRFFAVPSCYKLKQLLCWCKATFL